MSRRKIILIDEEKCNGCGQCVDACDEGALAIIDGKAKLVKDSFCDGLGACIGDCPEDALTIVEREADAFDEEAVKNHLRRQSHEHHAPQPEPGAATGHHEPATYGGCPGSALRSFTAMSAEGRNEVTNSGPADPSLLGHWPVQIMLIPPHAPFLKGADLLICADCVPFALRGFHERYLKGRAVLVGCPKLDDLDHYRQKLADIFAEARPARVTVLRMTVPCCGGISHAVLEARDRAAPEMPVEVHTIGVRGELAQIEEFPTQIYARKEA